jgi:hypothetical protein
MFTISSFCLAKFAPDWDNAQARTVTDTKAVPALKMKSLIAILAMVALMALSASAQSYSISWYKVAGGGGTSTNGPYTLSGTIGQPDASGAMTGGNYSVTGGFWAIIQVIQTAGAPTLFISYSANTVTVYWQNVTGWTLHQGSSLTSPTGWTLNSSWTTSNGTNYLQIMSPKGNEFYRLSNP